MPYASGLMLGLSCTVSGVLGALFSLRMASEYWWLQLFFSTALLGVAARSFIYAAKGEPADLALAMASAIAALMLPYGMLTSAAMVLAGILGILARRTR